MEGNVQEQLAGRRDVRMEEPVEEYDLHERYFRRDTLEPAEIKGYLSDRAANWST
jgi:hypothetical protein